MLNNDNSNINDQELSETDTQDARFLLQKDLNIIKRKYKSAKKRVSHISNALAKNLSKNGRRLSSKNKSIMVQIFQTASGEKQKNFQRDLLKVVSTNTDLANLLGAYRNFIFDNTTVVKLGDIHTKDEVVIDGLRYVPNTKIEDEIINQITTVLAQKKFNSPPNTQMFYDQFKNERKTKINQKEGQANGETVRVYFYKNENQYIEGLLFKASAVYNNNKGKIKVAVQKSQAKAEEMSVDSTDSAPNKEDNGVITPRTKTIEEKAKENCLNMLTDYEKNYWQER